MTDTYLRTSDSPPVPALQNKYATTASLDAAENDNMADNDDLPHWERPSLPAEKQERGRLRIRVNKTLEMRKAMNAENKASMDRKILNTPRNSYMPQEQNVQDVTERESVKNQGSLAFCISPPGSKRIQNDGGFDENRLEEQNSDRDWIEPDTSYYRENDDDKIMDVRQTAGAKKPPKKKPLVVRNTRTQNIRKQVAYDTMHPKDPAWLVRRKNLQAKIAIANEFKAKASKKTRINPTNAWTEQSYDIDNGEEYDAQTDRSVLSDYTNDEILSNRGEVHHEEDNVYRRERVDDVPDEDDDQTRDLRQSDWIKDDVGSQNDHLEGKEKRADGPPVAAMTFCISPPVKGPRSIRKTVPQPSYCEDDEKEDIQNEDMDDYLDESAEYNDITADHVDKETVAEDLDRQMTEEGRRTSEEPVKKKVKRKPLVVRNTRTQNIRKQVAQQIMYPEDPPWMKRRKNMQAKVAMAQAFKTKATRKPPINNTCGYDGYQDTASPRHGPFMESHRPPFFGGDEDVSSNMEYDEQNEDNVEDVVYHNQYREDGRTSTGFSVIPPIQASGKKTDNNDEKEMNDYGSAQNSQRTYPQDIIEDYADTDDANRVSERSLAGEEDYGQNEEMDDRYPNEDEGLCFDNNNEIPAPKASAKPSKIPIVPKKRPLIVRLTRTQNIRKQVAQEIMNPEDPPWVRKRKNLQEKIAMTNAFNSQNMQGKQKNGSGIPTPSFTQPVDNQHYVNSDMHEDDPEGSEIESEKHERMSCENDQYGMAFTISPPPRTRLPPIQPKGCEKVPTENTTESYPPITKPKKQSSKKKLVIRTTRAQEIKKKALQLQIEEVETPREEKWKFTPRKNRQYQQNEGMTVASSNKNINDHENAKHQQSSIIGELQDIPPQNGKCPQALSVPPNKEEQSKADDIQRLSKLQMIRNDMKSRSAILPNMPLPVSNRSTNPSESPEKSILGAMFASPTPRVNQTDDNSEWKETSKEKGVGDSFETERQKLDNSLRNHWKNLIESNLKDIMNLKRQLKLSKEKERFTEGVFEKVKLKLEIEQHLLYAKQGKGDGTVTSEEKSQRFRPSVADLKERLAKLRAQSSSVANMINSKKSLEAKSAPIMHSKLMMGDCFPRKGSLDLKEQYTRYRYLYCGEYSRRTIEPTFVTYGRERGRSHFAIALFGDNLYSSRKNGFIQVLRRIKEEIDDKKKTEESKTEPAQIEEKTSARQAKHTFKKALTPRKGSNKAVSPSGTSGKGTNSRKPVNQHVPKTERKTITNSQNTSKSGGASQNKPLEKAVSGKSPRNGFEKKRNVHSTSKSQNTKKPSPRPLKNNKIKKEGDDERKVDVGVMVNILPHSSTETPPPPNLGESVPKESTSSNKVPKKMKARIRSCFIKSTRIPAPTYNLRLASARKCSLDDDDDDEEDGPWTRPTKIPAPTQSLMYSNQRRYRSIEEL